jgi:hypothetical protein
MAWMTSFISESGSASSPTPTRPAGWSSASAPAPDLTAGNLGQHLSVLEKAELVHIEKGYEGKRPRTCHPTPEGESPPG